MTRPRYRVDASPSSARSEDHEADRWVAATAIHLGVPLVAHDAIFRNVDGLEPITRL